MIRNPGFHRCRHPECPVNASGVVIHEENATVAARFSSFFENPLVSRVKRRMDIRIVEFDRSTSLVEMCFGSGLPVTSCRMQPKHLAGLSRISFSPDDPYSFTSIA